MATAARRFLSALGSTNSGLVRSPSGRRCRFELFISSMRNNSVEAERHLCKLEIAWEYGGMVVLPYGQGDLFAGR
jgi:hypothetical protein